MKRISLDDLLHTRQDLDYQEQYEYIMKLLEKGQIKPVKASKSNGKKPALYREYWMVEEQKDYSNYIEEIKYTFSTMISVDYYLAHPDTYEKDRKQLFFFIFYLLRCLCEFWIRSWGRIRYFQIFQIRNTQYFQVTGI